MGYFRPVQAVSKPHSFEMAAGVTFERGAFLWLDSAGKATPTYANGLMPLGIADDDKATTNTEHIIGQILTGSAAVVATSGVSIIATGKTIPTAYQLTSQNATGLAGWKLEVLAAGVWTTAWDNGAVVTNSVFGGTGFTGLTVDLSATGDITLTITGTGMTAGTYSLRLTADYAASKVASGQTLVSDMFSNDSTAASSLVTVWFMDGIYESDQYDPYVAYTVGSTLYAKTAGILTSSSSSASTVGVVVKAPAANYTAETKTVSGHSQPKPEVVRFIMRLGLSM